MEENLQNQNNTEITSENAGIKQNKLLKVILLLLVLVVLITGAFYAGIQFSVKKIQSTLPSEIDKKSNNAQSNTIEQNGANSTNVPMASVGIKYREGEAISFVFSYPIGWSAYSEIADQSGEIVELFRLDPDPVWRFPHSDAFIEGEGRKSTSFTDFDKAVENFQRETTPKSLDWKTGDFKGSCFEYDYTGDMWGEVKGNVKCFVYAKSPEGRGFLGSYVLYSFGVFNGDGRIDKVDPNRSIIKFFFENLQSVPSLK